MHAVKALRPYLLDKPFELHPCNASLQWLLQQRHVSYQCPSPGAVAEHDGRVSAPRPAFPGQINQADFLSRKRFLDGPSPARSTGYDNPDSELDLFATSAAPSASAFVHSGPDPGMPRFLNADFAAAVRAALPADPDFSPLASALLAHPTPPTLLPVQGYKTGGDPGEESGVEKGADEQIIGDPPPSFPIYPPEYPLYEEPTSWPDMRVRRRDAREVA